MNNTTLLSGKTAVVTGATSGLGSATARELAANGAQVIITGRNEAALNKMAAEPGITAIATDHNDLQQVKRLAEKVQQQFGHIDILFLNAGVAQFSPVGQVTEEHYDTMMNVNVRGTFFTTQQFLPLLNDNGSIIFNASVNASIGAPGSSVYAATKAAVLAISKVLAKELQGRNIRVNAISPGPIDTPLHDNLGLSAEQAAQVSAALSNKLLQHRFGRPEDVARLVKFLASDEASFITGTEITIDGGLTIDPTS